MARCVHPKCQGSRESWVFRGRYEGVEGRGRIKLFERAAARRHFDGLCKKLCKFSIISLDVFHDVQIYRYFFPLFMLHLLSIR